MIVTSSPLDLNLLEHDHERTQALHVSDIYNSLYQEIDPSRFKHGTAPNTLKMAMGLAWEQYFERVLRANGIEAARPGQYQTKEGIWFSPDLYIVNGRDRIGEMKLTWMSESEDLGEPKFDKWKTQAMAYALQAGVPDVSFYVNFVNGNYKDRRDPSLRQYDLHFTNRELHENWKMLMSHARQRRML